MGLPLSAAKTLITSIDEGLDFLGWRIQRHRKPGTSQRYVYTYRPRKRSRPSWPRSRRSAGGTTTNPWQSCCASSTGCCTVLQESFSLLLDVA
jgi:RNA-directed DNA polymerase